MADNTDGEHLDNLTNTQPDIPSDDIIPSQDTETINPNQETENMEVHAHDLHKAPGQGWKHYLFEFLMLFLAVFCGFLAENWREHIVERQREKVLMKSMRKDLRADTTSFGQMTRGISVYISHIDSLIPIIKNNNDWNRSAKDIYQQQVWIYLYYKAVYSDRTIEQLKNSGNFRLIENAAVSDAIIQYDGYVKNFVISMQDEGLLNQWKKLDDCSAGIFRSVVFREWLKGWVNGVLRSQEIQLPPAPYFLSTDKKQIDTYINLLDKYAVLNEWFIQNTRLAVEKAMALDSLIKKEYHLE